MARRGRGECRGIFEKAERFSLAAAFGLYTIAFLGAGLALAVGRGRNPLRRRFAILSAVRVPRPLVRDRAIAVLDAERFRRLAADCRSAIADLLAAPCRRRAARPQSKPVACRRPGVRAALCRRRGRDPVFPRPRMARRRRAGRGAGFFVRRLGRVAHPARRPGRKPGLFAACAVDAGAGAGALVMARRRGRRRVCRVHRARPRSGVAASRSIVLIGLCVLALG